MRLITVALFALALAACGGSNKPDSPEPNRWVAMTPDTTDTISGIRISRDGSPLLALDVAETRRIYEWVQAHTGMVNVNPPHIIYTDKVIRCGDSTTDGCAWNSEPTTIAVQANNNTPNGIRTIVCHEIVHHLFYDAGYGADSEYNSEHAAPYYFACALEYLYE